MTHKGENREVRNRILKEILQEIEEEKRTRCAFPFWNNWMNWVNWRNWMNWRNWGNWVNW